MPDSSIKPADHQIEAALRLARLHALLSPRLLSQELSVDRADALRLLDAMESRGFVGPVIIAATGARESRVNIVMDAPAGDLLILAPTLNARDTRNVLVRGFLFAFLGVAGYSAIDGVGLGASIVDWFRIELGSRMLAVLVVAGLPILGPGLAWLAEAPFRGTDDRLSFRAGHIQRLIWQTTVLILGAFSLVRLLR